MKKKLFLVAALAVMATNMFALSITLKGGASWAVSESKTSDASWTSDLETRADGFGFYVGADLDVFSLGGLYLDFPMTFAKDYDYDGKRFSQGSKAETMALGFGVYLNIFSISKLQFYAGAGIGITWQTFEHDGAQSANFRESKYNGMGVNLKLGAKFFLLKSFGIDFFISDNICWATNERYQRTPTQSYDMADAKTFSNVFNVNLAVALKLGK